MDVSCSNWREIWNVNVSRICDFLVFTEGHCYCCMWYSSFSSAHKRYNSLVMCQQKTFSSAISKHPWCLLHFKPPLKIVRSSHMNMKTVETETVYLGPAFRLSFCFFQWEINQTLPDVNLNLVFPLQLMLHSRTSFFTDFVLGASRGSSFIIQSCCYKTLCCWIIKWNVSCCFGY